MLQLLLILWVSVVHAGFEPTSNSYYKRLGVNRYSSRDEVVNAYLDAIQQFDERSLERLLIQEAYDAITIPTLEALYEDGLRVNRRDRKENRGERNYVRKTKVVQNDEGALTTLLRDLLKARTVTGITNIEHIAFGIPDRKSDLPKYRWSESQEEKLKGAVDSALMERFASTKIPEERAQAITALYDRSPTHARRAINEYGDKSLRLHFELTEGLQMLFGGWRREATQYFTAVVHWRTMRELKEIGDKNRVKTFKKQHRFPTLSDGAGRRYDKFTGEIGQMANKEWTSIEQFNKELDRIEGLLDPKNPRYEGYISLVRDVLADNLVGFKQLRAHLDSTYSSINQFWPEVRKCDVRPLTDN